MNSEKQIQEIKKILNYTCNEFDENNRHIRNKCNSYDCEYWSEENYCCCSYGQKEAEAIYNAGYRKASEVALKVITEFEKIVDKYYNRHIFGVEDLSDVEQEAVMNFSDDITSDLAKLKKKYTEEKECITDKEIR